MPSPRAGLAFLVLLIAAALLQSTLSPRLFVLGGQPDFVFIVVIAGALLADAGFGALFGLGGGLLTAALVGETVGTFLVSRTLAGFVAGAVGARLFRGNVFVVMAGVALAALVAEGVYVLSAPGVAARHRPLDSGHARWQPLECRCLHCQSAPCSGGWAGAVTRNGSRGDGAGGPGLPKSGGI
jgi:rod shape-determining protein MreD